MDIATGEPAYTVNAIDAKTGESWSVTADDALVAWTEPIHRMKADGESPSQIARRLGISRQSVYNVLRRQVAWRATFWADAAGVSPEGVATSLGNNDRAEYGDGHAGGGSE